MPELEFATVQEIADELSNRMDAFVMAFETETTKDNWENELFWSGPPAQIIGLTHMLCHIATLEFVRTEGEDDGEDPNEHDAD